MEQINIVNLLKNSGLNVISIGDSFVEFQDPSCIFPAFDIVLHYAWIFVLILIGIILFGWGVLYIRNGIKLDSLFSNVKYLLLILTILALVKPIVNVIYGDNLFSKQCDTKKVSLSIVQDLLNQRDKQPEYQNTNKLYEIFEVTDSGVIDAGTTETVSISTQNNTDITFESTETTSNFQFVQYANQTTIYIDSNGNQTVRSGGSVAWRNNNPGNIKKSKFAMDNGAIGETDKWAVFPDERTGLNAVKKLLKTKNYNGLTISAAIHKWAPFSDGNNPTKYSENVSRMTQLPADTVIRDLSDNDLEKIARAIQRIEGWTPGTESRK